MNFYKLLTNKDLTLFTRQITNREDWIRSKERVSFEVSDESGQDFKLAEKYKMNSNAKLTNNSMVRIGSIS